MPRVTRPRVPSPRRAAAQACLALSFVISASGCTGGRGSFDVARATSPSQERIMLEAPRKTRPADPAGSFSGGSGLTMHGSDDSTVKSWETLGSNPVLGSRLSLPRSGSPVGAGGQPGSPSAPAAPPADVQRMMVYSAWLTIVVDAAQEAISRTEALATELGGYVERIQGSVILVRIPVARYQDALGRVEALGQVADRRLQAEDKTDEFVDLEARLKNAQAMRGRLMELLARAENVEAALKVELELKRVGEEIERLTAQLETLGKRIALCSISVTFQTVARQQRPATLGRLPFDWLGDLHPSNLLRN